MKPYRVISSLMQPCQTNTKHTCRISVEYTGKSWLNLKLSKKPAIFALQMSSSYKRILVLAFWFLLLQEMPAHEHALPRVLGTTSRGRMQNLQSCNFGEKGRRPSKPKQGRGKLSAAASQKCQTESEVVDFCKMVGGLVENFPSNTVVDFGENFNLVTEVLREYFCPVCLDILDKPIETNCEHYFCSEYIKKVVTISSSFSCPMCKEDSLNSMRVLT